MSYASTAADPGVEAAQESCTEVGPLTVAVYDPGTPGGLAPGAEVVTFRAGLAADNTPASLRARTVNVYAVDGLRSLAMNCAVPVVRCGTEPILTLFRYTS